MKKKKKQLISSSSRPSCHRCSGTKRFILPTVTCSKLYTGENSTTNIHMYTTPKTGRTELPFLPQNHHDQQGWHQQTNNALLYTIYLPNRSTLLPYGLILLPGQAASLLLGSSLVTQIVEDYSLRAERASQKGRDAP